MYLYISCVFIMKSILNMLIKVVYTYHIFDLLLKVCTSETPITKLASDYTPSELEFFKKLVSKLVPLFAHCFFYVVIFYCHKYCVCKLIVYLFVLRESFQL